MDPVVLRTKHRVCLTCVVGHPAEALIGQSHLPNTPQPLIDCSGGLLLCTAGIQPLKTLKNRLMEIP